MNLSMQFLGKRSQSSISFFPKEKKIDYKWKQNANSCRENKAVPPEEARTV